MKQLRIIGAIMDALVAAGSTFVIIFAVIFVPFLLIDIHHAPHDGQGGIGGFFIALPAGALSGVAMLAWALQWEPSLRNQKKYWWKQAMLALGAGVLFFVFSSYEAVWYQHQFASVMVAILIVGAWMGFATIRAFHGSPEE